MRTKTPTTFNSLSKAADALKSTLVDYTFAEVNNTKSLGPGYAIDKFDGICGMGPSGISVDGVPITQEIHGDGINDDTAGRRVTHDLQLKCFIIKACSD